jgi:hypothetical protein
MKDKILTERIVDIQYEKSSIGAWRVICPTCPLRKHLDALGMPAKACASGITTEMQCPVVINTCEFYEPESISSGDDGKEGIYIRCRKEVS